MCLLLVYVCVRVCCCLVYDVCLFCLCLCVLGLWHSLFSVMFGVCVVVIYIYGRVLVFACDVGFCLASCLWVCCCCCRFCCGCVCLWVVDILHGEHCLLVVNMLVCAWCCFCLVRYVLFVWVLLVFVCFQLSCLCVWVVVLIGYGVFMCCCVRVVVFWFLFGV